MPSKRQSLRIIGGDYGGQRLQFTATEELRPTGERVRETLFNWLQPVIRGARCLDMFAGSGLLGIEAVSRAAAEVILIERCRSTAAQLKSNITRLQITNARLICADALHAVATLKPTFDVVFIDPPFNANLLYKACTQLHRHHLLSPNGRVYLECKQPLTTAQLPQEWQIIRDKKAGQVYYYLLAT